MSSDPYNVLGIPPSAGKAEVKKAFREKALATHPDLNSNSASSAAEYDRVQKAAQAILNGTEYNPVARQGGTGNGRAWRPGFDQMSRRPRFAAWFSAACLVGGCIIFAGAVHMHTSIFDGYSYHVLEEVERRRDNPSPAQEKIKLLLMEKKEQQKFEKNT